MADPSVHQGQVLHLEILRQRQIYQVLTEAARQQRSQIIAASHSEVILNEAADRDVVVAFVGKPHRIDDRGSQLLKSLKEIGFEHYYQAEQVAGSRGRCANSDKRTRAAEDRRDPPEMVVTSLS